MLKRVKEAHPEWADAFAKRAEDDVLKPAVMTIERLDSIRSSGRYSPDGERRERQLAAYGFTEEKLSAVRTATVDKIQAQIDEQRAKALAALAPKTPTDPAAALSSELRARELREHLRRMPEQDVQALVRRDDGTTGLLDAIEQDPIAAVGGRWLAPRQVVQETKNRIAEQNHPELGDLASLQNAYTYLLGAAEQTILTASGLTKREVASSQEVSR